MDLLFILLICIGFVGAFFSGLLGIGGAIITIPLLLYVPGMLGVGVFSMKEITGMALVQVFFGSLSGVLAHQKMGHINREPVVVMGACMVFSSFVGAVVSKYIDGEVLKAVFAVIALVAAFTIFISKKNDEDQGFIKINFGKKLVAAGSAVGVGFLAGMIGVGGAFVLIPVMIRVLKIPTKTAMGSALVMLLFSAFAGILGKLSTGQLPLYNSLPLIIGALPGAQIGGLLNKKTRPVTLRRVLALVIDGNS